MTVTEQITSKSSQGEEEYRLFLEKQHPRDEEPASTWKRRFPQHLAALLAALPAVCAGSVDGWTASGIPYLEQPRNLTGNITLPGISYEEGSWIGSLSPLGSLIGAIPAGYLANLMGRKNLLLIMSIPTFISWIMIIFADYSIPLLYTARFIQGFTCGVMTVATPLYSEEIAEADIRGALGTYMDMMFTVGIFYAYILGAAFPYIWKSILSIILPVIFAVAFFWMPDSPMHLLSKGKDAKAEKALCWLRGTSKCTAAIEKELDEMKDFLSHNKVDLPCESVSPLENIRDFFKNISVSQGTLKAMTVIFGLMIFRQICGMNALIAYTVEIFQEAHSSLNPDSSTLIFGFVQIVATLLPYFIVDLAGRRTLLILSGGGMAVCLFGMVGRFYLIRMGIDLAFMGWIPLVAVNMYIIALSIGLGPLPWFIMAELLSSDAKSWMSSTAVSLNWTCAFLVTRYFLVMTNEMGPEATYFTFFIICVVGTLFIVVFVPETKMKTRNEIQNSLEGLSD